MIHRALVRPQYQSRPIDLVTAVLRPGLSHTHTRKPPAACLGCSPTTPPGSRLQASYPSFRLCTSQPRACNDPSGPLTTYHPPCTALPPRVCPPPVAARSPVCTWHQHHPPCPPLPPHPCYNEGASQALSHHHDRHLYAPSLRSSGHPPCRLPPSTPPTHLLHHHHTHLLLAHQAARLPPPFQPRGLLRPCCPPRRGPAWCRSPESCLPCHQDTPPSCAPGASSPGPQ